MSGTIAEQRHGHRTSGVLLPLSALNSAAGSAEVLGENAARFIRFLAEAGFSIWQMLPVHPPDPYHSPFQGCSVHAGDRALISLDRMRTCHWMGPAESRQEQGRSIDPMATALGQFLQNASAEDRAGYELFKRDHALWLDDYAAYCAIRQASDARPWWEWADGLRVREQSALERFASERASVIESYRFEQYVFFSQWRELRKLARDHGILLIGDMPLFATHDSADVWARPEYFMLDQAGQPLTVAGVPPDYFSKTGQRWGNPQYRWARMSDDGFQWWIDRVRTQLELFDLIKLDHFRGLESVWEIPADSRTAERGAWRPVPGRRILETLRAALGGLPFIAEDLGIITPPVEALRREFALPGMKVLQFAFDSDALNPYLPHNHDPDFIVYTGTHDNNTSLGWFNSLDRSQQLRVLDYLRQPGEPMPRPLIVAALASVCRVAVIPMQDLLGLGAEHRINTPGTTEGNWQWRLRWEWISPELAGTLRHLNRIYGRI